MRLYNNITCTPVNTSSSSKKPAFPSWLPPRTSSKPKEKEEGSSFGEKKEISPHNNGKQSGQEVDSVTTEFGLKLCVTDSTATATDSSRGSPFNSSPSTPYALGASDGFRFDLEEATIPKSQIPGTPESEGGNSTLTGSTISTHTTLRGRELYTVQQFDKRNPRILDCSLVSAENGDAAESHSVDSRDSQNSVPVVEHNSGGTISRKKLDRQDSMTPQAKPVARFPHHPRSPLIRSERSRSSISARRLKPKSRLSSEERKHPEGKLPKLHSRSSSHRRPVRSFCDLPSFEHANGPRKSCPVPSQPRVRNTLQTTRRRLQRSILQEDDSQSTSESRYSVPVYNPHSTSGSAISGESASSFGKYVAMAEAGVPWDMIIRRLTNDKVDVNIIHLVRLASCSGSDEEISC